MAFIDDDNVPPSVFKVVTVFQIAFQRINGNDAAVKVIKGVVIGRDAISHTSQSYRIQTDKGDRETTPPFLLELCQHRLRRDNENPFASPALYELCCEYSGFQRFTQAHRIGNQYAGTRLLQRLQGRIQLIRHQVHHPAMP